MRRQCIRHIHSIDWRRSITARHRFGLAALHVPHIRFPGGAWTHSMADRAGGARRFGSYLVKLPEKIIYIVVAMFAMGIISHAIPRHFLKGALTMDILTSVSLCVDYIK
jgi:hypothetical protein